MMKEERPSIGIVAGWGSFPIEVAKALKERGHSVVVAAVREHASEELKGLADQFAWVGVCKLGGMQKFFAKHQVSHVCLSGKLFKDRILFHGWGWLGHLPDWECVRTMLPNFYSRSSNTSDDSLLGAVVSSFARRGMKTVPGTEFAPQLLVEAGVLTARKPTRSEMADMEFGWEIAKQMGALDVGQSVTVRDRSILAVEGIEGTDACIVRTGQLCPRGGFSLVKVSKPQQDMRFDVPTIGLQTVQKMKLSGGTAIAIEAGKTILVDRKPTLELANKLGISIFSRSAIVSI
jgi:UDP-2,3-diacylglucosamine hydrolase